MIINDTHKFAFVHIPKCAGTTVRKKLQPFDQANGKFTGRIDKHPELGTIDYVHIPLFILQKHFSSEYEKIMTYSSFAVVRDPFKRFPSSLTQHLKKSGDRPIQQLKMQDIKKAVDKTINFLQGYNNSYLPHQYIHFQRQMDFIYAGQEKVVANVYNILEIPQMLMDISKILPISTESKNNEAPFQSNQSIFYRNTVVKAAAISVRPLLKILSPESKNVIRSLFASLVYVPRDTKLNDIFNSSYVKDFVRDYYADDIKLVNEYST